MGRFHWQFGSSRESTDLSGCCVRRVAEIETKNMSRPFAVVLFSSNRIGGFNYAYRSYIS
jgi:hypothetical protein